MTQCVVVCAQCRDDNGRPKRWEWLCETCAESCVEDHRRDTGHTDINLRVTREFTADDARALTERRKAFFVSRKYGW